MHGYKLFGHSLSAEEVYQVILNMKSIGVYTSGE